jgi:L-iditol 2-dehydrogenase
MFPEKLAIAKMMGADNGYTPTEISSPEFIASCNRSYDAIIDAVGLESIINSALLLIKMGGDICVYGVITGEPKLKLATAPYNFNLHIHRWPTRSEEKAAMITLAKWIKEGRLTASEFITHRLNITELEDALKAVECGQVLKAIFTF